MVLAINFVTIRGGQQAARLAALFQGNAANLLA
jgi:hypothetical protein